MRSEERSGIVFLALLLLWGTPLVEPFRIFADYVAEMFLSVGSYCGISVSSTLSSVLCLIIILVLTIFLLILSKQKISDYLAVICISFIACYIIYLTLATKTVLLRSTITFFVITLLVMVLYLLKNHNLLIWVSDFFIFSLPVLLFYALLIKSIDKLSFFASRQNTNLISSMDGFLGINKVVWGIFFIIVVAIPVVYFVPQRSKT